MKVKFVECVNLEKYRSNLILLGVSMKYIAKIGKKYSFWELPLRALRERLKFHKNNIWKIYSLFDKNVTSIFFNFKKQFIKINITLNWSILWRYDIVKDIKIYFQFFLLKIFISTIFLRFPLWKLVNAL